MKQLIIISAVAAMLSACSSTPNYSAQYEKQQAVQTAQLSSAVSQAPEWMSRLPRAAGFVFENGTATSTDFGFADIKAKTVAYSKICTAAGGKVSSQTKMFKSDSGSAGNEQSEFAARSICPDVDISGVETVEMKHVAEGNRIRTYVLVALPTGGQSARDAKSAAERAFKELDQAAESKSTAN